jgi:hypothetical protein
LAGRRLRRYQWRQQRLVDAPSPAEQVTGSCVLDGMAVPTPGRYREERHAAVAGAARL